MDELKIYTANETMKILKVTKRTLYNYIKSGNLKAVKIGNQWRIKEQDLQVFINKGTCKKSVEI